MNVNENKESVSLFAEFKELWDEEMTKEIGLPIFKQNEWFCIPINASFTNFTQKIFDITEVVLNKLSSPYYYIFPIDEQLERIKWVKSVENRLENGQSYSFEKESKCSFVEVERDENKGLIQKAISECDCFSFACFFAFDNTKEWCLIDMHYFPFSFLFIRHEQNTPHISGDLVAKANFDEMMYTSGAESINHFLSEKYKMIFINE